MPIPDRLFGALAAGAREAVLDAYLSTPHRAGHTRDEIDYLFALIRHGVRGLGAAWTPILTSSKISLRVTGVFCHQTPQAWYRDPTGGWKRPELADLLLVHEHTELVLKRPVTRRRAVLVQAKLAKCGVATGTGHQEYLYENWPDFELKGVGANNDRFLRGNRRFALGDALCRNGLVEDGSVFASPAPLIWGYPMPWSMAAPGRPMRSAGAEDLGGFLAHMLYLTTPMRGEDAGIPARPFWLSPGLPNNHFEVTVEELLTLTAAKTIKARNKSYLSGPRGENVLCFQHSAGPARAFGETGALFQPSGGGDEATPPAERVEEGRGGGVFLIETASTPT